MDLKRIIQNFNDGDWVDISPIFNVPDVTDLTINAFTILFVELELVSFLSRSYDMVIFEASSSGIGD